jgi:hypothetical protein
MCAILTEIPAGFGPPVGPPVPDALPLGAPFKAPVTAVVTVFTIWFRLIPGFAEPCTPITATSSVKSFCETALAPSLLQEFASQVRS